MFNLSPVMCGALRDKRDRLTYYVLKTPTLVINSYRGSEMKMCMWKMHVVILKNVEVSSNAYVRSFRTYGKIQSNVRWWFKKSGSGHYIRYADPDSHYIWLQILYKLYNIIQFMSLFISYYTSAMLRSCFWKANISRRIFHHGWTWSSILTRRWVIERACQVYIRISGAFVDTLRAVVIHY